MRPIDDKYDSVSSLDGEEYTSHKTDNINAIIASGQTPSLSDTFQQAKANSRAACTGNYFTDTGALSAANYVHLLPRSGNVTQPGNEAGMSVRFIPANINTSSTVVLKVGDLYEAYVSFERVTNPTHYPTVCPVGTLDTVKMLTAIFTLHPDSVHYYWHLQAVESADLGYQSVTEDKIASGAVTALKIPNGTLTGAKLQEATVTNYNMDSDQSLSKISQGEMDFVESAERVRMNAERLLYGTDDEPNMQLEKAGIYFGGTGSPGSFRREWRCAFYNIESQIAAASIADATTYNDSTVTTHHHNIGHQYIFTSNLDTEIPIGGHIFGATLTYFETSGRRIFGVPVIITTEDGATNYEIISVSIHNIKDPAIEILPDTASNIILCVQYSGRIFAP